MYIDIYLNTTHQLLHLSVCVGQARPSAMLTASRSRVPAMLTHVSSAMLFNACEFIFVRQKLCTTTGVIGLTNDLITTRLNQARCWQALVCKLKPWPT